MISIKLKHNNVKPSVNSDSCGYAVGRQEDHKSIK